MPAALVKDPNPLSDHWIIVIALMIWLFHQLGSFYLPFQLFPEEMGRPLRPIK